ncbi:phosphatidylserine decarboxylase [Helicobacter mesocricetorum]|uniref:phosphatidylserine decarboxylase n=1 Tax=Helicobacter mesocricetorum TaxID=87012 RepID=UPI000CF1B64D|nr:phosphatidylserine decarboxylase [Helicobacter mesocricetorum]
MHYTNFISHLFEKIAHYAFPRKIQVFINRTYVKFFGINMEEFDTLESYPTLNALFTRSFVKERQFDKTATTMIAPCDSLIMEFGECQNNLAMQIKGKSYSLKDFVAKKLEDGFFYVNFYLSPKDYHRFHAPINLKVKSVNFINGILLPVHKKSLQTNDNLFNKNKRVVLECVDDFGNPFYFIAIGALNVGRIQIHIIPELIYLKENKNFVLEKPYLLKKGEEIGCFEMGSTIVTLSTNWEYSIKNGEKIYFGESIGTHRGD